MTARIPAAPSPGGAAYILPNDVHRCHDAECPKHENCLRWIQRSTWRAGAFNVCQMATGRVDDQECDYFEPVLGTGSRR